MIRASRASSAGIIRSRPAISPTWPMIDALRDLSRQRPLQPRYHLGPEQLEREQRPFEIHRGMVVPEPQELVQVELSVIGQDLVDDIRGVPDDRPLLLELPVGHFEPPAGIAPFEDPLVRLLE